MPIYGGGPALPGLTPGVTSGNGNTGTYVLRSGDNSVSGSDPMLVAMGLNEADLLLPDGEWLFAARSSRDRRRLPFHRAAGRRASGHRLLFSGHASTALSDMGQAVDASCRAVCYGEEALLSACGG